MVDDVFSIIAATGFTVAFFHAAIPTHWLPFVLTARAQRWNHTKTLLITALAGAGHVLFTTVLGVLVVWFGRGLSNKVGRIFPFIAGGGLLLFGIYYLVRQFKGAGRANHHHDRHAREAGGHHEHQHDLMHEKEPLKTSDWAAIGSLFTLLTFSPCEGFLPVYLTGIGYGWFGFFVLSGILAGATLGGMILFTWLTLLGIEKIKWKFFEKYEAGILGGLLCLLGILVIFFEH
ncbi:MAG: hypothetical protein HY796_00275 [Elusimicrobia bacterium]|nr:hypothetical protein [Elusimicrobiota bacterium]